MNHLALKIWLSILLLATGVYAGMLVLRNFREAEVERDYTSDVYLKPPRPIGEFKYVERSGKSIQLDELRGHVAVVNFFFSTCPGTCRILNTKVADLQKEFADQDVRFVSISIDPAKDTPAALTDYAKGFTSDTQKWWFLTGPIENTQELGLALRLAVGIAPDGSPTHTDEIVVLDRAGVVRGAFDHRDSIKYAKAREKIRELLAETPPEAKPTGSTPAEAIPTGSKPSATGSAKPASMPSPTTTGTAK